MKIIFQKTDFPISHGGNVYEWEETETTFEIKNSGIFVIAVTASAKNKKQNGTTDDDDLRLSLNDYKFGQEEIHDAKKSWKGFGTASSWDGASLKGGEKTVFFFVKLEPGKQVLEFTADGQPVLKEIRVLQLDQKERVIENAVFDFQETAPGIKTDEGGVPWKSFVFQGQFNTEPFRVNLIDISAVCKSGQQKDSTDGDNIKVYANGKIVTNPQAPTSRKYQNYFFSGDLSKGTPETLMLSGDQFVFNQKDFSVEIWYDERPFLEEVKIEILGEPKYAQKKTLDRWLAKVAEWTSLPDEAKVNPFILRGTKGQAQDISYLYADKHNFFSFNKEGKKIRLLDDNEVDACRHFCWNVILVREFGVEDAVIISTNHEIFWKELRNKEDFIRSNIMDFWNNFQGREYAKKYPSKTPLELFYIAKENGDVVSDLQGVTIAKRKLILELIQDFL